MISFIERISASAITKRMHASRYRRQVISQPPLTPRLNRWDGPARIREAKCPRHDAPPPSLISYSRDIDYHAARASRARGAPCQHNGQFATMLLFDDRANALLDAFGFRARRRHAAATPTLFSLHYDIFAMIGNTPHRSAAYSLLSLAVAASHYIIAAPITLIFAQHGARSRRAASARKRARRAADGKPRRRIRMTGRSRPRKSRRRYYQHAWRRGLMISFFDFLPELRHFADARKLPRFRWLFAHLNSAIMFLQPAFRRHYRRCRAEGRWPFQPSRSSRHFVLAFRDAATHACSPRYGQP